jgi:PP-loop superfamily ATP-utilizing enzyme
MKQDPSKMSKQTEPVVVTITRQGQPSQPTTLVEKDDGTSTTTTTTIGTSATTSTSPFNLDKVETTQLVDDLLLSTRDLMQQHIPQHIIAFSGGVDSSVAAALVQHCHSPQQGESVKVVLGISPAVPQDQIDLAIRIAEHDLQLPLLQVATAEGTDETYIRNDGQACRACKTHLYSTLQAIVSSVTTPNEPQSHTQEQTSFTPHTKQRQFQLYNGTNADDLQDPTRVGLIAAREFDVQSPLQHVCKADVRRVAYHLGLSNWNYAASPCLRSRLAFGVAATADHLHLMATCEQLVRSKLRHVIDVTTNVRVRLLSGHRACIQIDTGSALEAAMSYSWEDLQSLGSFTSVEIQPFRSGSVARYVTNNTNTNDPRSKTAASSSSSSVLRRQYHTNTTNITGTFPTTSCTSRLHRSSHSRVNLPLPLFFFRQGQWPTVDTRTCSYHSSPPPPTATTLAGLPMATNGVGTSNLGPVLHFSQLNSQIHTTVASQFATPAITDETSDMAVPPETNSSQQSNPSSSSSHAMINWHQVFPPTEFVNPWETHYFASPLSNADLDNKIRHAIATLQQFYRAGYRKVPAFITPAMCKTLLDALIASPSSSTKDSSNDTSNKKNDKEEDVNDIQDSAASAQADRADALLRTMQLMNTLHAASAPFVLPRPNGAIYRSVLEILAHCQHKHNTLEWAHRARSLVQRMQQDYRQQADLYLRPTVVEWNLVLMACAASTHPDRAALAVDILRTDMGVLDADGMPAVTIDLSTVLHVLRACNTGTVQGAEYAVQVWHTLLHDPALRQRLWPTLPAAVYSTALRCFRYLPPSLEREHLFQQTWHFACMYGRVNVYVINEMLIHAKPLAIVVQAMGEERLRAVRGLHPQEASERLERMLPQEWTQRGYRQLPSYLM